MTLNRGGNTEERIVEAALRLFAQQGFSGTSTREIARLANVNETSLFRYFPRKQDLFWAAVQSRLDRLHLSKELQAGLAQQGTPEVVIPLIVEFLVQTAVFEPELIRLFYVSLLELSPAAERVCRLQLAPIFQVITDYVGRCVAEGILRPGVDPALTTISLATSILSHQSASRLLMDSSTPYNNTAEAISAYSAFWLSALIPENKAAAAAAGPSNGTR
jgi:AcrR family transcriptional regulator